MSVEIFQGENLREYGDLFVNGMAREDMLVLFAYCEVTYDGRGESFLDSGERMIVWKPDGNFQVHSDEKFKPVNYQPTGADTTVTYENEEEILRFVSERSSPNETLTVDCPRVDSLVRYDAEDTAKLDLSGTEEDMQMAIMNNPSLIEDGFTAIDYEYNIDLGAIDVFGEDADGTPVIIEIKRRKAQIKHIDQLSRYVQAYEEDTGETPRGILVAPDMSSTVETAVESRGLEYIYLDPLEI